MWEGPKRPWATETVLAACRIYSQWILKADGEGQGTLRPPPPCTCLTLVPGWPADSFKWDQKTFPTQGDGGEGEGSKFPFLLASPAS